MNDNAAGEQAAVDETRREARMEALETIGKLERAIRGDEGMGGIDAIVLGVLVQTLVQRVRVYGMTVNIGDSIEHGAAMEEIDARVLGFR